jgi:predicted permease
MNAFLQDLRYATRQLLRSPGFTIPAVLTLALGIGANTAIFSVVDGVLLRRAPFDDMDRLTMVWETDRASGTSHEPASVPDYLDFVRETKKFEMLAAFTATEASLTSDGSDPSRIAGLLVSHEFLPMVGLQPVLGRSFTEEEDQPGGPNVIIISESLWETMFARDNAVLGRTLRIDDIPRTIVGVLPSSADFGTLQILSAADYGRGFADRGRPRVDAWLPLQPDPVQLPRQTHPIFVAGKLGEGVSLAEAQQELGALAAQLEVTYPENDARGVHVQALSSVVFGPIRPALFVLLGAVVMVLLVACANVANLLLARGTAREREVTVRAALGASAGRLTRQFLVEGALLATTGAILGTVLALLGIQTLMALAPVEIPRVDAVTLDGRVFVMTLVVTALVALGFGLLPSLQARHLRAGGTLAPGASRGSAGPGQGKFRSGVVIAELALAVVLTAGAGLLVKSLWQLQQVDPGFSTEGVLKADFQLPEARYPQDFSVYPQWVEIERFEDELKMRVAALPGVNAVAIAGRHPLDAGFTSSISVLGREAEAGDWPEPSIRQVDAGYFETLRIRLIAGRRLEPTDDATAPTVLLINESAADRYFPGEDPLGQRIRLWGSNREIVGIIGNERFRGPADITPPAVYLPLKQAPSPTGSLLLRVDRNPEALAASVRAIVRDIDPSLPLFGVEPMAVTLSESMAQRRFTMLLLGIFATVALALAVVGVHGILTYTVAQRKREIGIRMALGADRRKVQQLIVGRGVLLTLGGLGIGLIGALVGTRAMRSLLFAVSPTDPGTIAAVGILLTAVAVVASYLPARRAAKVDPMEALRAE